MAVKAFSSFLKMSQASTHYSIIYPKRVPPKKFQHPIARQSKREKKAALAMQQQKGKAKWWKSVTRESVHIETHGLRHNVAFMHLI